MQGSGSEARRWRPLKCEGGPLDGLRRKLRHGADELVEQLDERTEAVYRVVWRRPRRQPRFAVLRFVGVRRPRPTPKASRAVRAQTSRPPREDDAA